MPDDNRLPTNQSQIDIEAALQDVKTAIANLNFILDAQNIAYDSNTSVKNKIDALEDGIANVNNWTSLGDLTSGGTGVDVSQYNTICILPKMQGWAVQNAQFIPKLLNTANSVAVYVNSSYSFSFRINFSSSGVLSIDNEALSGWTSCVYDIFAQ